MSSRSYEGTDQVTRISLAAGVISQDLVPSELGVFDWRTHVQASPLTYLAVLGTCALDAILAIVPSEAVVVAASILATRGELSICVIALAAAAGGFLGDTGSYLPGRTAWWPASSPAAGRWRSGRAWRAVGAIRMGSGGRVAPLSSVTTRRPWSMASQKMSGDLQGTRCC